MSALVKQQDMWTQYEAEQVDRLVVRARKLNLRGRSSDNYVTFEQPIEWVLISDVYLGEFAVQIQFAERPTMALEKNDPLTLTMAEGWRCQGRLSSLQGKLLVMMCPQAAANGIPPEQHPFQPAPPRQMGLGSERYGWRQ